MDYKNMNIFCITNNKGGVAKTTSTVDLAYAIADKGYKVLVIDGCGTKLASTLHCVRL
jgi:cellulose biosynthesis protein BcsQ